MLRDAVYLMYQASKNYIYVLKKNNDKNADAWIAKKHLDFNS